MFNKIYASRSQTRAMALYEPIGDPYGGVAYGERNDPVTAAVVIGGGIISGGLAASGAKDAANIQAQAGATAQANVLAAGQQGAQQYLPYQGVGTNAISALNTNMPYLTSQFSNQDLNANLAPNYGFMLDVGQRANLMNSNATGGAVGGNAGTALNAFSQNYAQNAYQHAFSNYTANQTNLYNKLSGLTGIGEAGATGAANAMIGTGTNVANIGTGNANAQAAGQIAQGNVYGSAISNIGNLAYLSSLGKGGPSSVGADLGASAGSNIGAVGTPPP